MLYFDVFFVSYCIIDWTVDTVLLVIVNHQLHMQEQHIYIYIDDEVRYYNTPPYPTCHSHP